MILLNYKDLAPDLPATGTNVCHCPWKPREPSPSLQATATVLVGTGTATVLVELVQRSLTCAFRPTHYVVPVVRARHYDDYVWEPNRTPL